MFVIGLFLLMSALSVAVWQGFLQKRKIEGVDWRREYIPRFLLGIFGVGVLLVPLLLSAVMILLSGIKSIPPGNTG